MSRWNSPLYNHLDKAIICMIVAAMVLMFNVANGAPLVSETATAAVFAAMVSVTVLAAVKWTPGVTA